MAGCFSSYALAVMLLHHLFETNTPETFYPWPERDFLGSGALRTLGVGRRTWDDNPHMSKAAIEDPWNAVGCACTDGTV